MNNFVLWPVNHDPDSLILYLLNSMNGIILVQNPSSLKKYELDILEKILKG
jgi:hypothetical protein